MLVYVISALILTLILALKVFKVVSYLNKKAWVINYLNNKTILRSLRFIIISYLPTFLVPNTIANKINIRKR